MEAIGTVSVARRQFHSGEQIGSPNLRDFLRINDEENYNTSGRNFSGPTLDSILHLERDSLGPVRVRSNRTLLDIIRDDPFHSNNNSSSRKTWRHRLRICLQGSGHNSGDDSAVPSHQESTTRLNGSSSVDGSDPSPAVMIEGISTRESGGGEGEQPGRMSLMALLEETDRQVGFVMEVDEREEQEEKPADKCGGGGGGEHSCCVCMVRHKGAAFIPCGHTFCRLCCRELWVQRGNCPLCNTLILEILDLF